MRQRTMGSAHAALLLCLLMAPPVSGQAASPSASAPARPTVAELRERALNNPIPAWRRGDLLVDRFNRGLYTYGPDRPGVSVCDLNCRRYWPPIYAEPEAKPSGPFTIATGEEGRPIWAWRGQPLYRWTGDTSRGSARGEVVNEWFLVRVPRDLLPEVVQYFPMPATPAAPR